MLTLGWLAVRAGAQDPFFTHFFNNESAYNPALTGYKGAMTFQSRYKTQWAGLNVRPFRSAAATLEESVPCGLFDYGLNMGFDEEGAGMFRTFDLGFRFAAYVVPTGSSKALVSNIRIGGGFQWSNKYVDYTRLIFSDQLDPKYGYRDVHGNLLGTDFVPPNDGYSSWFFTPSIGVSHRILFDGGNPRSPTLHYGVAVHNAYSIGSREFFGHEESVLNQGTKISSRYTAFCTYEFIPYMEEKVFISARPMLLYQYQGGLSYLELGSRFALNRFLGFGVYYHTSRPQASGGNTNWFTFNLEMGSVISSAHRVDLGFAYSSSLTGVRNYLGPIYEFSVAVHFASSPTCELIGRGDEVWYKKGPKCPTSAFTPGRRKMYENIWYKTGNQRDR